MLSLFFIILGLIFGSFLNACIHRFPREESIISPGSKCPNCSAAILWYHNIPVLSFLWLKGKCSSCGSKISPRYLVMEILSAVIWFLCGYFYGFNLTAVTAIFYFSVLLAICITDIETGLIPDEFSIGGMGVGLIASALIPSLHEQTIWYQGLKESVIGLLSGGVILLFVAWLGDKIFKKESMGGGDIKLLAMIGSFLGIKETMLVFFIAPIISLPIALYAKFVLKNEIIPYGPYLAVAGAVVFIWGRQWTPIFFGY